MILKYKSNDQMITDMVAYAVAQGAPITDFNQGSTLNTFFQATAWIISGFVGTARAAWEKALTDFIYVAFDFTRKVGTSSSVTLVFSNSTAVAIETTIPIGTIVKTADGILFETTSEGTILVGNTDSNAVQATSVETGSDKNVGASKIVVLESNVLNVTGVNNTIAATGGTDSESDAELQARFSLFVSNLAKSTINGYRTGALSVDGVKFANVVEDLGNYATVNLDFGAAAPVSEDRVIPSGFRIKTASGYVFVTTEESTITTGNTSVTGVAARGLNRGTEYNVNAVTIVQFVDNVTEVTTVNNPADSTGGTDGTLGIVDLLVDDGSGSVGTGVLDEVIKVIEGDPNDRENYPGYRGAGVIVRYGTPTVQAVDVTQQIYVAEGSVFEDIKTAVAEAQSAYINNLLLGQDVVISELKAAALTVAGVRDIDITLPATNVTIGKLEIAKPGTFTSTVSLFVDND